MADFKRSLFTFIQNNVSKIYKKKIKRIESIEISEIDNFHFNVLREELKDNIVAIPYYRNNINYKKALEKSNLNAFLNCLPVIDKKTIITNENFFDDTWKVGKRVHTTSGSSGAPLKIYNSLSERLYTEALIQNNVEKIIGEWGFKDLLVVSGFYINQKFSKENYYSVDILNNNIYCSIYHIGEEYIEKYKLLFDKYKPRIIYGYASTINQLAQLMRGQDISSVKLIITTSEVLNPQVRENISKVFSAPVVDLYGSQEGGHFAMECQYGVKHINPAKGIIEVLLPNGDICREGVGEAIVTSIYRPSFPLYRYNLKDTIKISKPSEKCKCGLFTYVIDSIEGRSEDLVITKDGRKIGYLNFHSTKNLDNIILESQLIQNGYDDFIFKCVFDKNINQQQKEKAFFNIKTSLEQRIGYEINLYLDDCEYIEKSARGKFKAVVVNKF